MIEFADENGAASATEETPEQKQIRQLMHALHCPFCGKTWANFKMGESTMDKMDDDAVVRPRAVFSVYCTWCATRGAIGWSPEEAVERWNERLPKWGSPIDALRHDLRTIEIARSHWHESRLLEQLGGYYTPDIAEFTRELMTSIGAMVQRIEWAIQESEKEGSDDAE